MSLLFALVIDWFVGDPPSLWKRLPHPVVVFGTVIDFLENKLNRPSLSDAETRGRGVIALSILVALALVTGAMMAWIFGALGLVGWVLEAITISIFIAQKSLADHVANVAFSLRVGGVECGRKSVSQIVGRNTDVLDEPGICRAAIESLAENFSDGVVAPVFWYLVFGLPGLIAYKAINTGDSMIGHKNSRFINFGRATALLDDLVNWPASRISSILIAISASIHDGFLFGLKVMRRTMQDAGTHRSPNAGWPETAMAASINIALGGPRNYGDESVTEPLLNASFSLKASVSDIDHSLRMFRTSCFALWVLAAFFALFAIG